MICVWENWKKNTIEMISNILAYAITKQRRRNK